ncbi:DsbA family protein [Ancylobacter amanitiformis]|uniref:Protein-disulfide isomerase n=1 Tax=Ancylobacter amanitiformis TaxID=217069 RepID=A0ABU0LRU2_9HYPH|nr:DsbA family protein [Ancylobacter amanitiformis]MDQ0511318.1 protein-disulfide isomerase [Ancylobacter amanitiformis]
MHRRGFLRSAAGVSLATFFAVPAVNTQQLGTRTLDVEALLFDPDAPNGGNAKGDVTIVAFFDYNCGYCRKASPALARLLREDGNIRLVYKDWPILSEASVVAAQLALAARYQDKYEIAHRTLMELPGRSSTERMMAALAGAGIDRKRLSIDLKAHAGDIGGLLKRNNEQALALELPGTPVYLIGPFKVAAALDLQGFKDVVSDARQRAADK